ncbi:MAG: hypothetical protein AAB895_01275 [Patescibacteria group bacterium]
MQPDQVIPSPPLRPNTLEKNTHRVTWFIAFPILIIVGFIGILLSYPEIFFKKDAAFIAEDNYVAAPLSWKTYLNEKFDLSLRYPPTMTLDESPDAWGFDDIYAVSIVGTTTDNTEFSLSISSTPDQTKCSDLVQSDTYSQLSSYTDTKTINGRVFLIGSNDLVTSYSSLKNFVYIEKQPFCKVAHVSYAYGGQAGKDLSTVDFKPMFEIIESIIGSMDTDVKDTGDANTMYTGESRYALSMELTSIQGVRYVASRIYTYGPEKSPLNTKSYIGTCTDAALVGTMPNITCRESKTEFIGYYKMNNRYGYVCADKDWYGIVTNEPKGFTCNSTSSVPATTKQSNTTDKTATNQVDISKISGPQKLNDGETGVWSVEVINPQKNMLTYGVMWGDEPEYKNMYGGMPLSAVKYQSSASFTHKYFKVSTTGTTWTPVFFVKDTAGNIFKRELEVNVGFSN